MYSYERRGALAVCQYRQRETLAFRFMMQRTRLFGLHLGEAMGMSEEAAAAYAETLVSVYVETGQDEDILDQALCDLHDIGVAEYRQVLKQKLQEAEAETENQFYH